MFRMYAKLRYSLLPYLYTAAHAASRSGMPVLRPMPLCFPGDPHSASLIRQYMLGDALLVAAFTDIVYLPVGEWIDYWTGERHAGPKTFECTIPDFAGGPLFVRAGAIIPTWPEGNQADRQIPVDIGLHFYVYEASDFTLYEDDGRSFDYVEGKCSLTRIRCWADRSQADIAIAARTGRFEGMPEQRIYNLYVHAEEKPFIIRLDGVVLPELNRCPAYPSEGWYFDRVSWQIHLCVEEDRSAAQSVRIEIRFDATQRRDGIQTLRNAERKSKRRSADSANQAGQTDAAVQGTCPPIAPYNLEHKLEIGLLSGDAPSLFDAFERFWSERVERNQPQSEVRERLLSLVGLFVRIGERLGWRLTEVAGEHYVRFMKLPELASLDEARLLVRTVIQQFLDHKQQVKGARAPDLIKQAIALIEGEMEQELTLKYAAERLHVNSSHLSRLFKREMGIVFSDYVLNHKMQLAKHMLLDNQKIGSVADALGYKDSSHFIRVFRNYWGLTPGELKGGPPRGGRASSDSNRA